MSEELLVVDAEAAMPDARAVDDVGRVEPAAEADLDDARVGGRAREGEEGGRGGDLEEAGLDAVARVEDLGEQGGEDARRRSAAGEADALVEADEMRAGKGVDPVARRLDRGAQEGAGRALAVGAGDMEDRRQPILRPAEPVEQGGDPLEPEPVAARRKERQPVELGLDGRMRPTARSPAITPPSSSPA